METPEQRRERLSYAVAQAVQPYERWSPMLAERLVRAVIASDEAAGMAVVPVEPTGEMLKAGSAALGALEYPTEDSNPWYQMEIKFGLHAPDCAVSYAAMIAAAKEPT